MIKSKQDAYEFLFDTWNKNTIENFEEIHNQRGINQSIFHSRSIINKSK